MEITVLHLHDPLPIAVWHLQGELAGSDEQMLIDEVKRESRAGVHYLVVDLSFLTCLDESGLDALKSAAALFGEDRTYGWNPDQPEGMRERVKLLHVSEDVKKILEETGSTNLFETCSDLRQAVKSFLL